MTNFIFLDVTLGLVFVYLLLALLCTTVNEGIAGALKRRSKTLEVGIRGLLDGPGTTGGMTAQFYGHPLVRALAEEGKRPSYIPARTFAQVLTDLVAKPAAGGGNAQEVLDKVTKLGDGPLKRSLETILQGTSGSAKLEEVQGRIENWYNDAMDRVSGWYKRGSAVWVAVVAVAVTLATNADTMQIAQTLWTSPTLRAAIVEQAKARTEKPLTVEYTNPESPEPSQPYETGVTMEKLTAEEEKLLGQLMGWGDEFRKFNRMVAEEKAGDQGKRCLAECKTAAAANDQCITDVVAGKKKEDSLACTCREVLKKVEHAGENESIPGRAFFQHCSLAGSWIWGLLSEHLLGWLLTAIAVSLGAPFWFDMLKKIVNLRAAGKEPEKVAKNGKKVPQGATT
ncbi:MAG TPA: hypothetical protein VI699_11610 [Candidatus Acidoferrales bacterium]|nr:hypothetical protein [Candidatus Acidoferrales bacterium]